MQALAARVATDLPPRLRAGDTVRWTCTVEAVRPLPAGSRIGLARRWPSDWGPPQTARPDAADHLAVETRPAVGLRLAVGREPSWHPFDHVLMLELLDPLPATGSVALRFGHEGPGHRVQTFYEESCALSVRLREPGASGWLEIGRPSVRVVGGLPARLVLTAPSTVAAGEPFRVHLRLEDRWGNPAEGPEMTVELDGAAGPVRIGGAAGPLARVEVGPLAAGIHRLGARDSAGLWRVTSNPIDCRPAPALRVRWGDLHGQSTIGCGARSFAGYLEHARDVAALDFAGHQANCFLVSAADWAEQQEVTRALHEPGAFVPLLGYEWSGETVVGGDRNLHFPGETGELRRCSHAFLEDTADLASDLPHVADLHAHFRGREVLGVLHVGGRTSNLDWHEPAFERLLEIHSTHATSEWILHEALARGYRMGVTAGSDGVDGRPGTSRPGRMTVRNLAGGLTAVALPELSRPALWRALRERRCWATTGARILLELEAEGRPMGSELRLAGPPTFAVRVEGSGPLESVELMRGSEPIAAASLAGEGRSDRLRLAWWGLAAPGNFARARMVWDGGLELLDARLLEAQGWAFDSPEEGIVAQSRTGLAWRSVTAGDWDGVILRLEEGPDAVLAVSTGPLSCRLPLARLGDAPRLVEAADPPRRLELRRLPLRPPPPGWAGTFRDPTAGPGTHAYWLRVAQADGERAWSSPIWVTIEPGAAAGRGAGTPPSSPPREAP